MKQIKNLLFILCVSLITIFGCKVDDTDDGLGIDGVYYRLVQYDFDGQTDTFDIVYSEYTQGRLDGDLPVELCDTLPVFCGEMPQSSTLDSLCGIYPTVCEALCTSTDALTEYCDALCNADPDNYPHLCEALPIVLRYFTVTEDFKSGGYQIEFATASEVDSDFVRLQGSLDGIKWKNIIRFPSEFPNGGEYRYWDNLDWISEL